MTEYCTAGCSFLFHFNKHIVVVLDYTVMQFLIHATFLLFVDYTLSLSQIGTLVRNTHVKVDLTIRFNHLLHKWNTVNLALKGYTFGDVH